MTADKVITRLGLEPHPEGGHFREIHRENDPAGGRGIVTSIYYLLKAGERSHWHRVDAVEIWNFHTQGGGAKGLALSISEDGHSARTVLLGDDFAAGQQVQGIVPPGAWQAASLSESGPGGWVLVGCTVSPAFEFDGFEMAPAGWAPGT